MDGPAGVKLEYIQVEVVPLMVATRLRVFVVPRAVVDGHPHFLRIAVVKVVGALHVSVGVEILRIPDIRIVIKAVPVGRGGRIAPLPAVGLLARILGRGGM